MKLSKLTFLLVVKLLVLSLLSYEVNAQQAERSTAPPSFTNPAEAEAPSLMVTFNQLLIRNGNMSDDLVGSYYDLSGPELYSIEAADDFVVPAGKIWQLQAFWILGTYNETNVPRPTHVNIHVYADNNGKPAENAILERINIPITEDVGNAGRFSIILANPIDVPSGRHWFSIMPRMDYDISGEWFWRLNISEEGHNYHWRNEGGFYGQQYTEWTDGPTVFTTEVGNNLAFILYGDELQDTSVDDPETDLPVKAELHGNYPNPFNPTTNIRFSLPETAPVNLSVYNVNGRHVETLLGGQMMSAGEHTVPFNAAGLSSGVYIVRMETANRVMSSRMMLIK